MNAWPTIPAICALLLIAVDFYGRLSSRTPRTPKWPAWWWITALVGLYVFELAIISFAARHEYPMEPWRWAMPLPVVDKSGVDIRHGNLTAAAMLVLSALESYILLAIYRTEAPRLAIRLGCGGLLLLSFFAPALVSFDLYSYVQYAAMGLRAYEPASFPLSGDYTIFHLWHDHTVTAPYGPLWLATAPLVTATLPTLLGKLLAFRVFSVALYFAFLGGLHALGLPSRIRNVAALNPGLMLQFVANGHNDLFPIVLIVWGAATVRARPPLAFLLIAAAGLVKLPYVVLGLPILTPIRLRWAILTGSALTITAVAAISWAIGGTAYVASLGAHVHEYPQDLAQHAAALMAFVLIVLATASQRRLRAAVWIVPMLSAAVYPWYFLWGLPYALTHRRVLSYLLVCFPFVTALTGLSLFMRVWQLTLLLPIVVIASIAWQRPFSGSRMLTSRAPTRPKTPNSTLLERP